MGINTTKLTGDDFIDTSIINTLVDNDIYLKNVMPTIWLGYSGGAFATTESEAVRISSGTLLIPTLKGAGSYTIKFPYAPRLPGPPVLQLTLEALNTPGVVYLSKWGSGYASANVKVALINSKGSVKNARIHWSLIHGVK